MKTQPPLYLSFLVISLIGLGFGAWFADMQVRAVAEGALATYPLQYFLITVIKCYLTIVFFFVSSNLVLSIISKNKTISSAVALTFLPLILVWVRVPLYWLVGSILLLQFLYLVTILQKQDYTRLINLYLVDGVVLLVLFVCHLFLTTSVSPLHWPMALLTAQGFNSQEIPVVAPIFKGFVLSKQFAFSNIDHAQWAAVMHPAVTFESPMLQFVTFILDLPSVSYEVFQKLIMATYFTSIIFGSFGFYLFLKYAGKIQTLLAFFGGYLFCFSGSPLFVQSFTSDGGIFLPALAVFPYALLFISLAFEKNNKVLAAWAGLALATQFFILAPHPEGTIYSIFIYGLYSLGLCLFTRQLWWAQGFKLVFIAGFTFLLLTAYHLIPIIVDRFNGDMYVFAHVSDIGANTMEYFIPYKRLIVIFAPVSFMLMFFYKKISPVYLSSSLVSICLLYLIILSTHQHFNEILINVFHIGIHIWVPSRIGVYFYISTFVVAIFGLNILNYSLYDLLTKYYPRLARRGV